jgi:glutamyl-tRNA synthetase
MLHYKTRLAPTPSGYLHFGNAVNFVITWTKARLVGGLVLLRIDDLDIARVRSEYVQDVFDTLEWLGLNWDQGPRTVEDLQKTWSQHRRISRYHAALNDLRSAGALFACTCSRSTIRHANPDMRYPGTCLNAGHSLDAPDVSWRLRTTHDLELRYVVVRQKDGIPAYNLASVVDDVDFGITHIARGADLEAASVVQRVLAESVPSLNSFLSTQIYLHKLLTDRDGVKLSKSQGATDLRIMVDIGEKPTRVFEQAAEILGLSTTSILELHRQT